MTNPLNPPNPMYPIRDLLTQAVFHHVEAMNLVEQARPLIEAQTHSTDQHVARLAKSGMDFIRVFESALNAADIPLDNVKTLAYLIDSATLENSTSAPHPMRVGGTRLGQARPLGGGG